MRKKLVVGATALGAVLTLAAGGWAHEPGHASELPAGPIRERHELMEGIGDNAKAIGDAMKKSDNTTVAMRAQKIEAASKQIVDLFPEGSTNPKSRAKPEIWKNWDQFKTDAQKLNTTAAALVAAAQGGSDVKAAGKEMFGACKACHDSFRVPDKDK
jgi:cytochrome c556